MQPGLNGAVGVNDRATLALLRVVDAVHCINHQVDNVRAGSAVTGERGYIDVGDTGVGTPVTYRHANIPLEVVAVGFEVTSVFSAGGLLAEELVLEASNRAFRIQQVGGHLAPGNEPD